MRCGRSDVVMTSDMRTAFSGVDLVIMLAKVDRNVSDSDHEYLRSVVRISRQHGAAINKYAKKTVKVVPLLISPVPLSVCQCVCAWVLLIELTAAADPAPFDGIRSTEKLGGRGIKVPYGLRGFHYRGSKGVLNLCKVILFETL